MHIAHMQALGSGSGFGSDSGPGPSQGTHKHTPITESNKLLVDRFRRSYEEQHFFSTLLLSFLVSPSFVIHFQLIFKAMPMIEHKVKQNEEHLSKTQFGALALSLSTQYTHSEYRT